MKILNITPPAVEPVTVAEVKTYTHISHSVEDALLSIWIAAARIIAEGYQRRHYITQTNDITYDDFPNTPIDLPYNPVQSITSIKYIDTNNDSNTVSTDDYFLDIGGIPGTIDLNHGVLWPTTQLRESSNVIIRVVSGYGDAADDVPANVKEAIMLYCAYRYENRSGEVTEIPRNFYDVLSFER